MAETVLAGEMLQATTRWLQRLDRRVRELEDGAS